MNIPNDLLAETWLWWAGGLYLVSWVIVLRTAPWKALLDNSQSHAFLGGCVLLLTLWSITATALPGLEFHYLGAMLMTLMFRWQLAFVALNLVLLGVVLSGGASWQTIPINGLTMGLIPVLVAYGIYRFSERALPNHFFVYVFVNAFFGAGVTLLVSILTTSTILMMADVYTFGQLTESYFPFLPLMVFPEAFITGFLITLLIAFLPGWVLTFDDALYLKGK